MSALRLSHPGQRPRLVVDTDPELALTPRQRAYLVALRSVNWNRGRAAELLGVETHIVQNVIGHIRDQGHPIPDGCRSRQRRRKVTPAMRATIFDLHDRGQAHRAIARQVGVSYNTVASVLRTDR